MTNKNYIYRLSTVIYLQIFSFLIVKLLSVKFTFEDFFQGKTVCRFISNDNNYQVNSKLFLTYNNLFLDYPMKCQKQMKCGHHNLSEFSLLHKNILFSVI